MNPSLRFLGAALLAAGLLTLNTGCFALAVGAGAGAAVAYVRGDLEAPLDASFARATRAANLAIEQLKFSKVSENADALVGTIIARNADDRRIEIRVESSGASQSKVRIRVGVLGDETLSLAILDRIKANL